MAFMMRLASAGAAVRAGRSRRPPRDGLRRTRFACLDERKKKLHRARLSGGGPIDELFDCCLEFGDALAVAVLGHRNPLAESRCDHGGKALDALGPAARIAGHAWAKHRRKRRTAIADSIVLAGRGIIMLVAHRTFSF